MDILRPPAESPTRSLLLAAGVALTLVTSCGGSVPETSHDIHPEATQEQESPADEAFLSGLSECDFADSKGAADKQAVWVAAGVLEVETPQGNEAVARPVYLPGGKKGEWDLASVEYNPKQDSEKPYIFHKLGRQVTRAFAHEGIIDPVTQVPKSNYNLFACDFRGSEIHNQRPHPMASVVTLEGFVGFDLEPHGELRASFNVGDNGFARTWTSLMSKGGVGVPLGQNFSANPDTDNGYKEANYRKK